MKLSPTYDRAPVLSIEGADDCQLVPLTRQRRRMESMLHQLDDEQWATQSRCERWTVRDVVAHLVGVNAFWHASVRAGVAGTPTRVLGAFDPVTTPLRMVESMSAMTSAEVLAEFSKTNEAFLDCVVGLRESDWSTIAETPAGHVPVRLLAQHALWDCWIHERDIAVPLGIDTPAQADEVTSCLQYAAAIGATLAPEAVESSVGSFAIEATEPEVRLVIHVGDSVSVRNGAASAGVPVLRGDATLLTETLSLRAPMPSTAPTEWKQLREALATAFDAV